MNNPIRSLVSRPVRSLAQVPCVALGIALGAGCQSPETHELGLTESAQNLELESESTEPFFTPIAPFGGLWIGQAENPLAPAGADRTYHFPSGSTQILLDLTDPEVYYGKLTFGAGETPPPPTDPNVGYPVGVDYAELLSYVDPPLVVPPSTNPLPPFEGFEYTANRRVPADELALNDDLNFDAADGVIKLQYNTSELLQPWCALQTPLAGSNGHFDCAPEFDEYFVQSDDGVTCSYFGRPDRSQCPPDVEDLPIGEAGPILLECEGPEPLLGTLDCDKAFLCDPSDASPGANFRGVCECDATSCRVNLDTRDAILLLRSEGDELMGVFAGDAAFLNERGYSIRLGSVRFQRVE